MDDDLKFFGTDKRRGFGRVMLDAVGGSDGFKTKIVVVNGETITLRTRGGFPRIYGFKKAVEPVITSIVETVFALREYFSPRNLLSKVSKVITNDGDLVLAKAPDDGAATSTHYAGVELKSTDGYFSYFNGSPKSITIGATEYPLLDISNSNRDATQDALETIVAGKMTRTFYNETYISNLGGYSGTVVVKLLPIKTIVANDTNETGVEFKEPTDAGDPVPNGPGVSSGYELPGPLPFDHVRKFGYPWHGLYRAATHKVTPPVGAPFDMRGDSPSLGDVYMFKIDGIPDQSTTSAESAAGMSWLNYLMFSGSDRVLYGRQINADSIFIDSDGVPWCASVSVSGNRSSKIMYAGVWVSRLSINGATRYYIGEVSVAFSTNSSYPKDSATNQGVCEKLDVSDDGRKILIGVNRSDGMYANGYGYAAIAELTITGNPGSDPEANMSMSISVLADEATEEWLVQDNTYNAGKKVTLTWTPIWLTTKPPLNSGVTSYPSGTGIEWMGDDQYYYHEGPDNWARQATNHFQIVDTTPGDEHEGGVRLHGIESFKLHTNYLGGARYKNGAVEIIRVVCDSESSIAAGSVSLPADFVTTWGYYGFIDMPTFTVDVMHDTTSKTKFSLYIGSEIKDQYEASASGTAKQTCTSEALRGNFSSVQHTYSFTCSDTTGFSKTLTLSESTGYGFGSGPFLYLMFGSFAYPRRYSNSVYGMMHNRPYDAGSYIGYKAQVSKVIGKIGSNNSIYQANSLTYTDLASTPIFCSEHPVTGEIARESSSVCWV